MLPERVNLLSKMAAPDTGDLFLSPPKMNRSLAQSLLEEESCSIAEKSDRTVEYEARVRNSGQCTQSGVSDIPSIMSLQSDNSSMDRIRYSGSVEETSHSSQSISVCSLEGNADSAITSSSSCLEEESLFRMDAMDDSSRTSSDDEDGTPTDSTAGVSASPLSASSSVFLSPSSSVGVSHHASRVAFLATSTPMPGFCPRYRNQESSNDKESLILDEYSKIKMLAASMPSTKEEQQRIIPVLRGLSPLEENAALLIRRPLVESFRSPISNVRTTSNLQRNGILAKSDWCNSRQSGPKDMPFFSHVNDDLSPTIVKDIASCRFDFSVPGLMATPALPLRIPGSQDLTEEVGRIGAGCDTIRLSKSRRRLDTFFENSLPNSNAKESRLENRTPTDRNRPAALKSAISQKITKRKFRTEDEEAVHYLVLKYLEM